MTLFELKQLFETKQAELSETDFDKWVDKFWTENGHNTTEKEVKLVIKDLKRNKEIELNYNKNNGTFEAVNEV